jgi:hydroxyacylglutathione hydrolase
MFFEQFYLGCLAHASYMLGSGGEAAVVDPQRDVELYLETAEQQKLKIRYIFETHLHADFVSGHRELAARTGATVYIGAKAGATFQHVPLSDGFELRFGDVRLNVLETPGHTPESLCLVVTDLAKSRDPVMVLTGDTLFIGDVGRPDLAPQLSPQQLAGMLYDSLHNKVLRLPDATLVYPAHGAGSLCGRQMRNERSSTIGTERLTNYALQIADPDQFIQELTANLPPRPAYFAQDAEINRGGAEALTDLPLLQAISAQELRASMDQGALVLDTRSPQEFGAGHVPGSVNISLSGQFASWAGTVLGLAAAPVIIAESREKAEESRLRLARVGIEQAQRYLEGGVQACADAGYQLQTLPQVTAHDVAEQIRSRQVQVLDVRREPEWIAGHIAGAHFCPLDGFANSLPEIDRSQSLAVHCKSGYRSSIACSLLLKAGYTNIVNVVGGFDAWQEAGEAVETGPVPQMASAASETHTG